MVRSDTLFGKRTGSVLNPPLSASSTQGQINASRQALSQPDSAQVVAMPATNPATGDEEAGSKLIVGPNIKLKGVEITDCDTLVVEGRVEATIRARVIQIAEHGVFRGSADIDVAEIRGEFEGELTVHERLVIFSTGKVSGKIRYGKLVIEEGGQLSGDVRVDAAAGPTGLTAAKPTRQSEERQSASQL